MSYANILYIMVNNPDLILIPSITDVPIFVLKWNRSWKGMATWYALQPNNEIHVPLLFVTYTYKKCLIRLPFMVITYTRSCSVFFVSFFCWFHSIYTLSTYLCIPIILSIQWDALGDAPWNIFCWTAWWNTTKLCSQSSRKRWDMEWDSTSNACRNIVGFMFSWNIARRYEVV